MQEVDAERRLAILRGEKPAIIQKEEVISDDKVKTTDETEPPSRHSHKHRKRKHQGEDDTSFELRLAKEARCHQVDGRELGRNSTSSASIMDKSGHIDLLGEDRIRRHTGTNDEVNKEKLEAKRKAEEQYTMRLAKAGGNLGQQKTWYSQDSKDTNQHVSKDVWGNDDPKRAERDAQRLFSNDPLAMMKKGASTVRKLKQERAQLQEERDKELRQLRKDEHRRERHQRRKEQQGRCHERSRSPRRSQPQHINDTRRQDPELSRDRRRQRGERRHDDSRRIG